MVETVPHEVIKMRCRVEYKKEVIPEKKISLCRGKKKSKSTNASASKSKNEAMQTNIHYPKTWTSRQKKANIDLLTLNLVKLPSLS